MDHYTDIKAWRAAAGPNIKQVMGHQQFSVSNAAGDIIGHWDGSIDKGWLNLPLKGGVPVKPGSPVVGKPAVVTPVVKPPEPTFPVHEPMPTSHPTLGLGEPVRRFPNV